MTETPFHLNDMAPRRARPRWPWIAAATLGALVVATVAVVAYTAGARTTEPDAQPAPAASSAIAVRSTTPSPTPPAPRLDERATCVLAVPLLDTAATLIQEFAAADNPLTLDQPTYITNAEDLRRLVTVAAESLRRDIEVISDVMERIRRVVTTGGTIRIEMATVGAAGIAVGTACRKYAVG